MSEEMVKVSLGDDYYLGAYFNAQNGPRDYEIPKSQWERWEAATAAYEAMQNEIEQVMRDQRDKVWALRQAKPSPLGDMIQKVYGPAIEASLRATFPGGTS